MKDGQRYTDIIQFFFVYVWVYCAIKGSLIHRVIYFESKNVIWLSTETEKKNKEWKIGTHVNSLTWHIALWTFFSLVLLALHHTKRLIYFSITLRSFHFFALCFTFSLFYVIFRCGRLFYISKLCVCTLI